MTSETHNAAEAPSQDKRSCNKAVLIFLGFCFGLLFASLRRFLPDYQGPWGAKLALVLAPWIMVGILIPLTTRFYREDELEVLINRKALVFAFYTAFFGLMVLELFQAGGFVPRFAWTNERLILGLAILMGAGMIWSKRRYD
jgi:hypothetical protein